MANYRNNSRNQRLNRARRTSRNTQRVTNSTAVRGDTKPIINRTAQGTSVSFNGPGGGSTRNVLNRNSSRVSPMNTRQNLGNHQHSGHHMVQNMDWGTSTHIHQTMNQQGGQHSTTNPSHMNTHDMSHTHNTSTVNAGRGGHSHQVMSLASNHPEHGHHGGGNDHPGGSSHGGAYTYAGGTDNVGHAHGTNENNFINNMGGNHNHTTGNMSVQSGTGNCPPGTHMMPDRSCMSDNDPSMNSGGYRRGSRRARTTTRTRRNY